VDGFQVLWVLRWCLQHSRPHPQVPAAQQHGQVHHLLLHTTQHSCWVAAVTSLGLFSIACSPSCISGTCLLSCCISSGTAAWLLLLLWLAAELRVACWC
jgi:hypothetical protein